ncbi:MAG: sensor histidine kinase [Ruminococcus flavefaciens]|nr:sensor histidine kinase [Ruminococcus flavefaciens]MCM1231045.1 sensor histidine kinase [Ruminococcus flavefaciens]
MRLFFKYIHQYRYTLLLFLLFSAIFAGIFVLYGENPETVMYAFLLCSAIGAGAVISGFLRFRKHYTILRNIYSNLPLNIDKLPEAENPYQEILQEIIIRLNEISNEKITNLKDIQHDSIDYFTVWVHQIKTPISAMQMILQSEDTDENRMLLSELFRVEQYAEMALYYLRLDSTSTDFVIGRFSLDNIIKQAVHRYAPQFIHKKIRLIYSPVEAEVLTDEKWLLFMIEQLLSNAVKYTIKGSVTIKFVNNLLIVSDTGIGISPEDLPRIFEKGYTGLSGRRDRKSTGLGLYLCKRTADNLGHVISVSSVVGRGTNFYIDLSHKNIDIE